jgi:hypothetical protein
METGFKRSLFAFDDLVTFCFSNKLNRQLYLKRKRCFLTFLLLISSLPGIYYIYGQHKSQTTRNLTKYLNRPSLNFNERKYTTEINKAIEFITKTLENEYNRNDLISFYQVVEKEFRLGLRCMRKTIQPETTIDPNFSTDNQTHRSITTIGTALRYRPKHNKNKVGISFE